MFIARTTTHCVCISFVAVTIAWFVKEFKNLAYNTEVYTFGQCTHDFMRDDWQKFNSTTHVCEKLFGCGYAIIATDRVIQRLRVLKL